MRRTQQQYSVEEQRAWDQLMEALRERAALERVREIVDSCPGCLGMVTPVIDGNNRTAIDGFTALHYACMFAHDDTVRIAKFLIQKRPKLIHETSRTGALPIHVAVRYVALLSVVQFLAVPSPDSLLQRTLDEGKTVLYEAVECRAPLDVVAYLTAKEPQALRIKANDGTVPLHAAAANVLPLSVVRCLTHEWMGGLQERDNDGRVPTHLAALHGADPDVLQFLTDECPGSVEILDHQLDIPLHCAAQQSDSSGNVQWLVDRYPAGARARNRNGMLPLHWAAQLNNVDAVQVLLAADPETAKEATIDGRLALHLAAQQNSVGVVRVLYDAYPEGTQAAANDGSLPLHLAAEFGTLCSVQLLVDRDPKALQHKRKDGLLPLHLSALRSLLLGSSLDVIYLLARRWPEAIGGLVGGSRSPQRRQVDLSIGQAAAAARPAQYVSCIIHLHNPTLHSFASTGTVGPPRLTVHPKNLRAGGITREIAAPITSHSNERFRHSGTTYLAASEPVAAATCGPASYMQLVKVVPNY